MANRRMFSKTIIDADEFLDMPPTARLLYYDLGMRADDDGFVQPNKVVKITGSSPDDLKILIAKNLVIAFENNKILVIADWKIHNNIRVDRYNETIYKEYKKLLFLNENSQYRALNRDCIPDVIPEVCQMGDTGKVRLGKVRIESTAENPAVPPSLLKERNLHLEVRKLFDYFISEFSKKISVGKKPIFNWGRCEKQAKDFLKNISLDRMIKLVNCYFDSDNKFYKEKGWGLQLFLSDTVIHELNTKCKT